MVAEVRVDDGGGEDVSTEGQGVESDSEAPDLDVTGRERAVEGGEGFEVVVGDGEATTVVFVVAEE
ncbi:hypothetical protein [Amycolatopsis sp. NPDC051128]|uniref:hypothetical protein n=1 Tax=Amycolatopsis sp. NPDC051128 TaxID=3155412 RepID=UPI003448A577